MYWFMEQRRSRMSNKCLQEKVDYVIKNSPKKRRKSFSKPLSSISFLGCSVSKEETAPDPKHFEKLKKEKPISNMEQLESFVG